jgi:NAD(P)-dependent dehydrogenase (short-subunit alcohol dehydrogenase family)
MFYSDYRDKVVVVTGAASGMGAATTAKLAEAGATIIGGDIAPINSAEIDGRHLDLTDEQSIKKFVDGIKDDSVNALFHCAGLPQTFAADKVITVNFVGARHFLESMLPKMADGSAVSAVASLVIGWPQHVANLLPVINTDSFDAGVAWARANAEGPDLAATQGDPYMFSKEALACWCTMMAPRWIQRGVRLNVLGPGPTATPMMGEFEKAVGEQMAALPLPIGRQSTAEEQANLMLMINHPAASFLVGATIYADGGMSAALMTLMTSGLVDMG